MRTINGIGTTIYGHARRQELFGEERVAAEQSGYLPFTYQVVKWFVVLYLPVIPLGTFRVLKARQKFWTTEFPQYQMVQVAWDLRQIGVHYAIAYGWIPTLVALAFLADAL